MHENRAEPDNSGVEAGRFRRVLLALAVIGLALRLWGISWSLPDRDHFYSYHPDEILVLMASHGASIWDGSLNPHFYNYGSLPVYSISLLRPLAYTVLSPGLYTDYLLGRFLTALFGAATILVAGGLARRIAGNTAGLLSAGLLAVAPAHAVHSHYVTVDVPATFWTTLGLYGAVRVLTGGGTAFTLLAGAAAGFAAGTKYNAGLVWLALLMAHCLRPSESGWSGRITGLLIGAVSAVSAFLFSTPGVLLWSDEFQRDFAYELSHARTGHGLVFTATSPGWIHHWVVNMRWGLGLPLLLLVTAALALAIWRFTRRWSMSPLESADRAVAVLLAFAVPYYLLIGGASVKFLRYTIPLMPVLLTILAVEGTRRWQAWHARDPIAIPLHRIAMGAAIGVAVFTTAYTLSSLQLFSRTPPQDQALAWLKTFATGQSIGLTTVPWFYSPPVSPYNAGPQSRRAFERHGSEAPFRIVVTENDSSRIREAAPEFLVLSEFETADPIRLMNDPITARLPEVRRFAESYRFIRDRYRPVFTARSRPFLAPDPFSTEHPPHDWLYPYPEIVVWKRQEGSASTRDE